MSFWLLWSSATLEKKKSLNFYRETATQPHRRACVPALQAGYRAVPRTQVPSKSGIPDVLPQECSKKHVQSAKPVGARWVLSQAYFSRDIHILKAS